MSNKKKHHYVPVTYLKEFTDSAGKLFVYRKDVSRKVLHQKPENTAFRKYYYAQPLDNGERNLNALEDQFSTYEAKWKRFLEKARKYEVGSSELETLIQFIILQHVRVPATRDMVELHLADQVKATAESLDRLGELPPPPKGFEDILSKANFTIAPFKSLQIMKNIAEEFGSILARLGFGILINKTDLPFITSDNPVVWFDPKYEERDIVPYTVSRNGGVFLVFPLSKDMIVIGSTVDKSAFDQNGLMAGSISSKKEIGELNRLIAKFSYEAFFASEKGDNMKLLEEFADFSPTVNKYDQSTNGLNALPKRLFAKRREKARWEGR